MTHRNHSPDAAVRAARRLAWMIALLCTIGCKAVDAAPIIPRGNTIDSQETFAFVHGVRIYVSAVNCEMNADDAARLNALAATPGLAIEVVFTGVADHDTTVVSQARADLGLTVPVRLIRQNEVVQYKSIGGAALPMALIVKGRQLKTIVAGESMPRTMSIVEASLSSIAPHHNNQSPEG